MVSKFNLQVSCERVEIYCSVFFICRTALHWACKRGHVEVVKHLLKFGADASVANFKGELPAHVTTSSDVLALVPDVPRHSRSGPGDPEFELPFIPNYLKNPPFPYYDMTQPPSQTAHKNSESTTMTELLQAVSLCHSDPVLVASYGCNSADQNSPAAPSSSPSSSSAINLPLIVKARLADSGECDFVEVEVEAMSFQALLRACCEELEVSVMEVSKIRKLPNVIVRKDRDVQRMRTGQELELVLESDPRT